METFITLVKEAKQNNRHAMQLIINRFKPKLDSSLTQTSSQEREDLKQEVSLRIIEAIYRYDLNSTPGFWEFYESVKSKVNKEK